MASPALVVRTVRPGDWEALAALFGPRGACGGCWCMFWRCPSRPAFEALKGPKARSALRRLVRSGKHRGLIAFEGREAVGWLNLGPRSEFPLLERSRAFRIDDPSGVWSANCFFIRRDKRGQGIGKALLAAAVASARRQGARVLEGYPTVTATRLPAAFMYRGSLPLFEKTGFAVASHKYRGSPLMRHALGRRPPR